MKKARTKHIVLYELLKLCSIQLLIKCYKVVHDRIKLCLKLSIRQAPLQYLFCITPLSFL